MQRTFTDITQGYLIIIAHAIHVESLLRYIFNWLLFQKCKAIYAEINKFKTKLKLSCFAAE